MTALLVDEDKLQAKFAAFRNETIEECAAVLDQEASFNERVACDNSDNLDTRARAAHAAHVKRTSANLLRTMKT